MANQLIGSVDTNFVDSRAADPQYQSGSLSANRPATNLNDLSSVASLRNALSVFDPITYNAAALELLNVNDMLFAWRACKGNEESISDYHPAQVART